MTTISLTHDDDWRTLLTYLPGNYEQLANDHRQLQVQYGNAKITTADWLLRFILLHVGANLPLIQTVALIAEAGGPKLSAMRLHMKMRRAAPYLQALVERMVPWRTDARAEQWAGYSMTAVDSSVVCKPGSTGVDARLHTKLRIADVAILDAIVTDVSGGDSFKRFFFEQNELVLADRGFCNPGNVARAVEHGADVLIRYNRGTLTLWSVEGRVDALATVRAMRRDAVLDLPVAFEHGDDTYRGRFIATQLPAPEAEQARKRLRAELGKEATAESIEAAGYVMLFTTAPRERMTASKCLLAYQLRWQVELQFKRWKSLCGFDRLPNYRDDTIIAWLYAKLLLGVLLDRMSGVRTELSPPVQLAAIAPMPRKPRRRRPTTDGAAAVASDERPVPADDRRAPSALSA
jgi:Transposase DDE domain